jgi:hypothetical protein
MNVWTEWNWLRSYDKTVIAVFTKASANTIITFLGNSSLAALSHFQKRPVYGMEIVYVVNKNRSLIKADSTFSGIGANLIHLIIFHSL